MINYIYFFIYLIFSPRTRLALRQYWTFSTSAPSPRHFDELALSRTTNDLHSIARQHEHHQDVRQQQQLIDNRNATHQPALKHARHASTRQLTPPPAGRFDSQSEKQLTLPPGGAVDSTTTKPPPPPPPPGG